MAMNKALPRTLRSLSAHRITRRSFVTENLKVEDDVNKGGVSNSRIRIWWDLETCHVPVYYQPALIIRNLRDALGRIHCCGPVEIWAYADMSSVLSGTLIQLHNSGVKLRHLPQGNEMRYHVMVADMIAWSTHNPPPAIHMVMAWDEGYVGFNTPMQEAMHQLRVQGYYTFPCRPEKLYPYYMPLHKEGAWAWETFLAGPTTCKLDPVRCKLGVPFGQRYKSKSQ